MGKRATTVVTNLGKVIGTGPDGWVRIRMPIESAEQALPDLLRLGAEVEILAPRELRDKAIEVLRAMTRLYEL